MLLKTFPHMIHGKSGLEKIFMTVKAFSPMRLTGTN